MTVLYNVLNGPPAVNRLSSKGVSSGMYKFVGAGPLRLSRISRGNNKQTPATPRPRLLLSRTNNNKLCRVFISTERERSRLYESLVERFLLRATEYVA